jgi:hypothetical protein
MNPLRFFLPAVDKQEEVFERLSDAMCNIVCKLEISDAVIQLKMEGI